MSLAEDILIERYLKRELTEAERAAFLERLAVDGDFKEKVMFEKQLFESLNENDWSFNEKGYSVELKAYQAHFESDEARDIKATLFNANERYQKRQKDRSIKWFAYPVAAAVLFIVAFFGLRISHDSSQELFLTYLGKPEIGSLTIRGDENLNSDLIIAQAFFDNQEYERAESLYDNILKNSSRHSAIYINLAICQIHLKEFENAHITLDQLLNSDLLDSQKGYWYKSLVYLASDEIDKSKELLNGIIDNDFFNHELAEQLLKELN